jgi:hypothetical protein
MDRINKEGYVDVTSKSGDLNRYATQIISSVHSLFTFHVHLIIAYLLGPRKGFVLSNQREFDGTTEQ